MKQQIIKLFEATLNFNHFKWFKWVQLCIYKSEYIKYIRK